MSEWSALCYDDEFSPDSVIEGFGQTPSEALEDVAGQLKQNENINKRWNRKKYDKE